ncbi:4,5-dihydroxyphthalate decarboxylase [Pigmentiphaga sp. NML080357]|uniref:ABC transporter substrate-binding protein n=1 Tax=Pigmentiphaga sp. NML080357 TaxID=2008675 RepID=UPI000B40CF34|nr:ABC transporter substrate-binding protein [Pigmentiphaga sp. NML080357]OVZ55449.1 4,5-dihydroxyphthalate decarboxylase [Pigmentiphaga sp. NML080357]
MMSRLQLSLGCCDYDRTRALFDGRVAIEGCDLVPLALHPEEIFHRAFNGQEFDICELSLSSHTVMTARGQADYVAIPAFVSRVFRHSGIYIRTDRGIERPEDLKGRTIGVPEYQITANVWIRGMLQDDYGVRPNEVRWRRGGVEQPGREERAPLQLPPDIDLRQIPDTDTLSGQLESGELDAVFSAKAPSCVTRGAPHVGLLFPRFREVERAYFERTRIFPIMHVVGIRRALVDRHPWLPVSVYKAFVEAKRLAMEELAQIGHLYASLPWGVAEYHASRELMGDDFWSYGLEANRHVLDAFTRYHHEQGLSPRKVAPEELFHPNVLKLSKN